MDELGEDEEGAEAESGSFKCDGDGLVTPHVLHCMGSDRECSKRSSMEIKRKTLPGDGSEERRRGGCSGSWRGMNCAMSLQSAVYMDVERWRRLCWRRRLG